MTDDQALKTAIEEGDLDTVCSFINTQEDFDSIVLMAEELTGPASKLTMLLSNEFPEFAAVDDDEEEGEGDDEE